MIFIAKADGSLSLVIPSAVNQGSVGVNELVLIAPYPKGSAVTAAFILPNGIRTTPTLSSATEIPDVIEGTTYNAWVFELTAAITEFAGKVAVQFSVTADGKTLKTYADTFTVSKGVPPELPDAPTEDIFNQIIDAYSNISIRMSAAETSIDEIKKEIGTNDTALSIKGRITTAESEIENIPIRKGEGLSSVATEMGNATGDYSSAFGYNTSASGGSSHAEGVETSASTDADHSEGGGTKASGGRSHAEGTLTSSSGWASHAEGNNTTAGGHASHAEGRNSSASGDYSHSEGQDTSASGQSAHAEGRNSKASGDYSHSEGQDTSSIGRCSHAAGELSTANAICSTAQGYNSKTNESAEFSHATGLGVQTARAAQFACGAYNAEEPNALFVVGNGSVDRRATAFKIGDDGSMTLGGVMVTPEQLSALRGYKLVKMSRTISRTNAGSYFTAPIYTVDTHPGASYYASAEYGCVRVNSGYVWTEMTFSEIVDNEVFDRACIPNLWFKTPFTVADFFGQPSVSSRRDYYGYVAIVFKGYTDDTKNVLNADIYYVEEA